MLAGAAALLATGASAQTLTNEWTNTSSTGVGTQSQYGGQLRFNTGKDGKLLVTNMAEYKIVAFTAEGAEDYCDLKPAFEEHYGYTAQEISKIDTIVSETNDSTFDTTWVDVQKIPAAGPALAMDDAGNFLVAAAAAGSSTPDFLIISADLQSSYKLQLTMPEGVTPGRMDQCGKIVGDMLSAEGAYLWLCPQTSASVAIIKIVEGAQDMDYSQASAATPYANTSSCLAQPSLWTVAEIDALMDDEGDLTRSFYWRHRSYAASVYTWEGVEDLTSGMKAITVATGGASNEGFAAFKLGEDVYFVVPVVDAANARSAWFSVVKEDGSVMATVESAHTGISSFRSFSVEPIDETSVRIYNWVPAKEASSYVFSVAAEEPAPAVDPLYIFGSFNNWAPAEALELTYVDSTKVYTIEDVEFATEGGNFALSTVKSSNWDEVNANRYGFAEDNAKAVIGENTIVKGTGAIAVPYVGVWDITVDLEAMTLTLATETPEPQPEPEPVVVAPGLNMVWENTATADFPGKNDARFASAKDGKIIVNDKANKKIMAIEENGVTELVDLATAIDSYYGYDAKEISKIDTIVSETNDSTFDTTWVDVRKDSGLGTAIAVDDAGNIIVNTGFPNAASSTDFIIVSADLQNTYKLQITMPEGVAAARMDQMGRVRGNLLSEEGAYMFLTPNGSTQAAIIKVVNGEQVVDMSQASGIMGVTFNTTTLAQPMNMTVEEIDALMDEYGDLSMSFYVRSRSSNPNVYGFGLDEEGNVVAKTWTMPNSESGATVKGASQDGFETFALKGVNYFIVPLTTDGTSAGRCTAFAIFTEAGEKVATYEENAIVTGSATNMSLIVVPVNDEAVEIYHYAPSVIAAKYTFALEKEAEPLYLIGDVNGTGWSTSASLPMTYADGKYTIENVEVNPAYTGATVGYFAFVTVQGADWAVVNASTRYGAQTEDEAIALNTATTMIETWNSWSIEAGKTYNFVVDLTAMTVTVSQNVGVEGIEAEENAPAVYYNLQGVKVANPENGIYIKVQGNKASKVLVK